MYLALKSALNIFSLFHNFLYIYIGDHSHKCLKFLHIVLSNIKNINKMFLIYTVDLYSR